MLHDGGGQVPFGTCNLWYEKYYMIPGRKKRWAWLNTTSFDETTPPEDVWPASVQPSWHIFPLNKLPFGPEKVFPVPGQVYASLKTDYSLTWNATCGGWQTDSEKKCSDFHRKVPFVFVTPYRNGSALLSLKLGQNVLRTHLFESSVPLLRVHGAREDQIAYLPLN